MKKLNAPFQMNRLFSLASLTTLSCIAHFTPANAQLVPDNTLGTESSVVTPNVNIRGIPSDRIDGGAVRNGNLFHSFQEFNVEAGRGVYFSNPDSIVNILTRVTGENLSTILGTLGVLGNANLFLINPNGIVFGPNARLDVGGSFFASTADSIIFNNGFEFAASNPQAPPLLTINIPIGLNLRENPGNIVVEGEGNNFTPDPTQGANILTQNRTEGLRVQPNQRLALIGGNIILNGGNLIAPTGRIELGSVQSGEVILPTETNPRFNYQNVTQLGNIQLSNAASVDVVGEGGGVINVQGQSVSLTEGSVIIADTSGGIPGGSLTLFVLDTIELIGESSLGVPSGLFANVSPSGTAPGSTLTVNTSNLILDQGGKIAADTFSQTQQGIGGTLTINAQQVNLDNNSQISTGTFGEANAGTLTINTQNLNVQNSSRILANSLGNGRGGELVINAENIILQNTTVETPEDEIMGSQPENNPDNGMMPDQPANNPENGMIPSELGNNPDDGMISSEPGNNMPQTARISAGSNSNGDGGNIAINTNNLTIENGNIFVGADSVGTGGSLSVTANNIIITGEGSGIFADVSGSGDAGQLTLNTQNLNINNSGRISTRTTGMGNAGSLAINTESLSIENGEIRANTDAEGRGGNLNITANNIAISGGGLFADTNGSGNAGQLTLNTQNLNINNSGRISTRTTGMGNAGSLTINTESLIVENADIRADTDGMGNGGNLLIRANNMTVTGMNAGLSADVQPMGIGNSGTVIIEAETLNVNNNAEIRAGTVSKIATEGSANGGSLTINTNRLVVDGGSILTNTRSVGNAGDININAEEIILIGIDGIERSGLFADAQGEQTGDAGTVTINTSNLTVLNGAEIRVGTLGTGNAGSVIIDAQNILVQDGAEISTDTKGSGNAGILTINADKITVQETATIPDNPQDRAGIVVEADASGNAGELTLNTQQITVRNGGRISTRTTGSGNAGSAIINTDSLIIEGGEILANTAGEGDAGNLTIRANDITLTATDIEQESGLFADVQREGTGNGGTVNIETQNLNVRNNAQIRAGTVGTGNAGNLFIDAENILVQDGAEISTDTKGSGNAGTLTINAENITVEETTQTSTLPERTARIVAETDGSGESGVVSLNTENLTVQNGGRVSSRTRGVGDAGTLNINTDNLIVEGGEIQADTSGEGNAGNVNVTANNIELIGTETEGQLSGLFADVRPTATGNGGTVTVNSGNLTVRNGGEIRVQSQGEGNPGSINVTAFNILLDRQGQLSARSVTGQGGDITLQANDIRLRRQSKIEASGSQSNPTLDGNITIDTNLLLLLEGSSITTNAFNPAGGSNITIRPFGSSNLTILQSQNSIINAAGNLTIDSTLNFDPPETSEVKVVNPQELIAKTPCQEGDESEFIITGRGGLPPNPTQGTRQPGVSLSLTEPVETQNRQQHSSNRQHSRHSNSVDHNVQPLSSDEIVPARGWIRTEEGEVILVGYDPTQTQPLRQLQNPTICSPSSETTED